MSTPQQPELRRSGRTVLGQDNAADVAEERPTTRQRRRARPGPVPPENEPGHHPEVEQDKPDAPPPTAAGRSREDDDEEEPAGERTPAIRFPFEFDARLVPLATAFGVVPSKAYVDVDGSELHIRFGPWSLRTALDNVREVTPTGPYRWWKVAGPPRISVVDRGVTFATTTAGGMCICFHRPVPAALPTSAFRHPAATVTVASPTALAEALRPAG